MTMGKVVVAHYGRPTRSGRPGASRPTAALLEIAPNQPVRLFITIDAKRKTSESNDSGAKATEIAWSRVLRLRSRASGTIAAVSARNELGPAGIDNRSMHALTEMFGPEAAEDLQQWAHDHDRSMRTDEPLWDPKGCSGAKLAVVVIGDRPPAREAPEKVIAKMCRSGGCDDEAARHRSARKYSSEAFAKHHLVELRQAIRLRSRDLILLQGITGGGLRQCLPMAELPEEEHIAVTRGVVRAILEQWTPNVFTAEGTNVADFLRGEFKRVDLPLDKLLDDVIAASRTQEDGNGSTLVKECGETQVLYDLLSTRESSPVEQYGFQALLGNSHGDLHEYNIMVCGNSETHDTEQFWLIDLCTFDHKAPLTRDVAALTMSIVARQLKTLSCVQRDALLRYLVEKSAQDRNKLPLDTVNAIEAVLYCQPQAVKDKGFLDDWLIQLRICLLVEALRCSSFSSFDAATRQWLVMLAAYLGSSVLRTAGQPTSSSPPRHGSETTRPSTIGEERRHEVDEAPRPEERKTTGISSNDDSSDTGPNTRRGNRRWTVIKGVILMAAGVCMLVTFVAPGKQLIPDSPPTASPSPRTVPSETPPTNPPNLPPPESSKTRQSPTGEITSGPHSTKKTSSGPRSNRTWLSSSRTSAAPTQVDCQPDKPITCVLGGILATQLKYPPVPSGNGINFKPSAVSSDQVHGVPFEDSHQYFPWGLPSEGLAWPVVQLVLHNSEVGVTVQAKLGTFREILSK